MVIDRRNSVIARMDSKIDAAKKTIRSAASNPTLVVPCVDDAPAGSISSAELDRDAQFILDLGAQRVEAARSLVELLNQAEMDIMSEILETETTLAETKKLHTSPLTRDIPYQPTSANPDEHFCICRGLTVGQMVSCDNPQCPFQWFHIECVGLKSVPEETWFCPYCTAIMRSASPPKIRPSDRQVEQTQ
ncbi:PHD-finger family protein [Tritrichomonas foetus]|uniref:PHD-finger family protein n=1 Tax=Tritrichomonas foetus TaxID=1144522 RepID=A0A1J4KJJ2_9EUKA|nr:PHD-finger family protein [Tritrichomonas foetus]|eukprot:OHT11266.1 PHD-finger family protein [Tritrichomonas foetus]